MPRRVVVVGAAAAGCPVVGELLRSDADVAIDLVSGEHGLPYDRPPLSKQYLLGKWSDDQVALRVDLSDHRVTWRPQDPAASLDPAGRCVYLTSGVSLPYDDVVIATGSRPRRLAHLEAHGPHVLRSLDDSRALRSAVEQAGRLTIVGGGFVGLEVASSCRSIDVDVVVVEPDRDALGRRVGEVTARRLIGLHDAAGVAFAWGARPATVDPVLDPGRIRLEDARTVPAAPLLVAVGAEPVTDWLAGTELVVDDGVVCDDHGRAAPGVWAVGDVARWHHPRYGRSLRLEHRQNATDQGRLVARAILGANTPWDAVPFFWTDQLGVKVQVAGLVGPDHVIDSVEGHLDDDSYVLTLVSPSAPRAVVAWNAPARMTHHRRELALAS